MDAGTEADEVLRQQQQLFAARMQNGPHYPEYDDVPFEELETRYNKACGAYMFSQRNGKVCPLEEDIYYRLQAQYDKAKARQDEPHRSKLETTMDGSRRRKASPSPLFVQQDQPTHHERTNTTEKPSGSNRKRVKTSSNPSESSGLPEVDESIVYSVGRLVTNAPANKKQAAIRDGDRILHAIKKFPPGSIEYDGGDAWSISGMKTSLKHHQLINVGWMVEQESDGTGPSGGILADEMGLGKTITALASMIHGKTTFGSSKLTTNLVVVPKSLKEQWYSEARSHTKRLAPENTLGLGHIYMYSPQTSVKVQLQEFKEASLVIVTYSELKSGFKNFSYPKDLSNAEKDAYFDKNYRSGLSALFQYKFRAIYLDEGHDIRNSKTLRTMACQKPQSEFRWILTGTPMTNNPTDLYSALTFVRDPKVSKLTVKEFNDYYKGSSKKDINVGWLANTLQRCMSRWTHSDTLFGRQLVEIPKPMIKNICKDLSVPEMIIYSTLRDRLKALALERSTDPDSAKSYNYIDGLLTVLRQMTGHVLLIRPVIFKYLTAEDMSTIYDTIHDNETTALSKPTEVSAGQRIKAESAEPVASDLQTHAKSYITALRKLQKSTTCIVCKERAQDIRWAECYHAYCKPCLKERMHRDAEQGFYKPRCKPCGLPMGHFTDEADDAGEENPRWLTESGDVIPSTKSSVVVELLKSWRDPRTGDSQAKAVVFTMFKECHKFLAATFKQEQWEFATLTADMSTGEREKSVDRFMDDPDKFIMLATNGVGGIGLNLMAAKY
jgi:SNF2 family DNA or RNA helicase